MARTGRDEKVFVERELVPVNRMPTRNTLSFCKPRSSPGTSAKYSVLRARAVCAEL